MFELRIVDGQKILVYVNRFPRSGERGMWVEVCHSNDKEAQYFVNTNRQLGAEVELDEHGMYRAHVLKD